MSAGMNWVDKTMNEGKLMAERNEIVLMARGATEQGIQCPYLSGVVKCCPVLLYLALCSLLVSEGWLKCKGKIH